MPSYERSHSPSMGTSPACGTAYPFILEHIFKYPGTYELPLRTMLTLNAQPFSQPKPISRPDTPSSVGSSSDAHFEASQIAAAHFTSSLVNHITKLPSQPCSLPPAFITNFLRRCFPSELMMVDFPQALTGLDYLKDLETRRRREIASALRRLGLQRENLGNELEELARTYPAVATWFNTIEESERKIESYYTQLFVTLRRWILINEMHLQPFNKHNCVAMLNTLYPPAITPQNQPTAKLTPAVMKSQRDGFFRYIKAVETRGPSILNDLMSQGARPGDDNAWPAVRDLLDKYLRIANNVVDECLNITDLKYFDLDTLGVRDGKKVDSGVSFVSGDRPSTSGSNVSSASDKNKPLPSAPAFVPHQAISSSKNSSTLEKIAREIRRLKSRKSDELESGSRSKTPDQSVRPKTPEPSNGKLRKARSLGTLRSRSKSPAPGGRLPDQDVAFDKEEMRRQRLLYEARGQTSSFES